jgi:GNAT superfamily N-acetyltransferase
LQEVIIRKATAKDAGIILEFIKELAIYEKAEKEVVATVTDIKNNLFDINTTTKAIICTYKNKPIGFAVYFFNFSTWLGRNGLYLEDVYVFPDFRRMGIGKKLLKYLAQVAVKNNCARLELSVLDWNKPAIKFYESINAKAQSEWIGYRLEGDNLLNFAKDSS